MRATAFSAAVAKVLAGAQRWHHWRGGAAAAGSNAAVRWDNPL